MADIIPLIILIYSDVIEPIFCVIYAYILIKIWLAKSSEFRSAFYKFSIATGIAAISNVLDNWTMRMIDVRFTIFPNRGFFCNILSWLSHFCALVINIGKTLSVSTRYTSICVINRRDFWEGRRVPICLAAMIGIPFALFFFFPFFPPNFGQTPNGYGVYLGITNPGFLIAKSIGTFGYFGFPLATVPMCIKALLRLRTQRISASEIRNASQAGLKVGRHEKILGFYAVVLTISHLFKTCVWYFGLIMGLKDLQAAAISMYLLPNTVSTFAEPVLLLMTSSKLRDEVFSCRRGNNSTVAVSTNPSHTTMTRNETNHSVANLV